MRGFCCICGLRIGRSVFRAEPAMTKPIARDPIYRRRGFDAEIIELCVRWDISYRLSYRDLVELMADRGIAAAQAFFRKALTSHPRGPRKVTLDGHAPTRP